MNEKEIMEQIANALFYRCDKNKDQILTYIEEYRPVVFRLVLPKKLTEAFETLFEKYWYKNHEGTTRFDIEAVIYEFLELGLRTCCSEEKEKSEKNRISAELLKVFEEFSTNLIDYGEDACRQIFHEICDVSERDGKFEGGNENGNQHNRNEHKDSRRSEH